ncbi:potassium channel family protein [Parageobacillus thermoglucosidasius]|uniref:potassium channel family protein n=1 Tax=Parageobacillus thermoglucosidasius TaxID=1426 RepID=UPI0001D1870A|nr:potassium channel protein [Parageobacillus thermoglucosidasius]AEH46653.1 Ion transport 2 domain protein [Parageobacillus thermoglucosidasius C56-YS93]
MKNWDVFISYLRLPVFMRLLIIGTIMIVIFGTLIHFVEPATFRHVFDGIWWAIVTAATIGYGDMVPKTVAGKIVAISLILLGTGVITTYFASLSAAAVAKESALSNGQLRYMQKGHIIIVGWNERAREVIAKLSEYTPPVRCVIIDATLNELPVPFKNVHFIKGNPSYDDVLHKANATEAQMILITANQHKNEADADKDSILTLLAVKGIHPSIYAIVEILTEQNVNNAKRAGADEVIQTNLLASFTMANSLQSPGVSKAIIELLHQLHGKKLQLIAAEGPLIGKTFLESSEMLLDKRMILIGVMREEEGYINPSPHFLIEKGDRLFVITP